MTKTEDLVQKMVEKTKSGKLRWRVANKSPDGRTSYQAKIGDTHAAVIPPPSAGFPCRVIFQTDRSVGPGAEKTFASLKHGPLPQMLYDAVQASAMGADLMIAEALAYLDTLGGDS